MLYYSKIDYKKSSAQGQVLADNATWKCDDKEAGTKRVQSVLVCAGILPPKNNNHFSSEQAALQYYFSHLKVPDPFHPKMKKKQQSFSTQTSSFSSLSTYSTVLRGLERQIASPLADEKILVTQNILEKARNVNSMDGAQQQSQEELARYAAQQTSKARRFARLLGKADAAILGLSTSCSNKKASLVSK